MLMLRRKFIENSFLLATITGLRTRISEDFNTYLANDKNTMENARLVLLTMQRQSREQGMASQAFLDSGDYNLVELITFETIYYLTNSSESEKEKSLSDASMAGEAIVFTAQETKDKSITEVVNNITSYILDQVPEIEKNIYLYNDQEVTLASVFQILPFLAAAGYADEAYSQVIALKNLLLDKKKNLFYPAYNVLKKEITQEGFWGSGNGLVIAGLTRILRYIPSQMEEEKEELTELLNSLIDGCLAYIRDDGLFHNIIDDPTSFVETNLSQMLAYAIFSGIYYGRLDFKYREKADLMRKAANSKIDAHGFVNEVCNFTDRSTPCKSAEGQVFYILMETAANRLYH